MNKIKKAYYAAMYEITDSIMWLTINDTDPTRTRWNHWWDISEGFREKRDALV